MPLKKVNTFLDAEWHLNQRIFLVGYAITSPRGDVFGQLYGKTLSRVQFKRIVKKTTGYIFGYGPDIGMTEKFFQWNYRKKFRCVNLLRCFRDFIKIGSFKLADLERKFRIRRKVQKYKHTIFQIWRDWKHPQKRYAVLTYNKEDVINLVRITRKIFSKYKVSHDYLKSIRLV